MRRLLKESAYLISALALLVLGLEQTLNLGLLNMVICLCMGVMVIPVILLSGMHEVKAKRSRTLDHAIFSMTYRFGLLIQSGYSVRKALLLAMESDEVLWTSFPLWKALRVRLVQGGDYEASLQQLELFDHVTTRSWTRCCLYGERKSESDLVLMLHEWMNEFKMEVKRDEVKHQAAGQLWMMMPALSQFGVLMILLISPIFLGGL